MKFLVTSLLAAACGLTAAAQGGATYRRVLLEPGFAADDLKGGPFRRMALAEFDRVAAAAGRPAASLNEARYTAEWVAGDLVGGGEWAVRGPAKGTSFLPLGGLSVALRSAKWGGKRDAWTVGGGDPALAVGPGDGSLDLRWSARGVPEPGGVRFDLGWPAAAVATLELTLPAGLTVSAPAGGAEVVGPLPADQGHKVWRVLFGGKGRVRLAVRGDSGPDAVRPLVLTRLKSRHAVGPGLCESTFRFEVTARHAPVESLTLEADAGLRLTGVSVGGTPAGPVPLGGSRSAYRVDLPAEFYGGVVEARAVSPVTAGRRWVMPDMAVRGAVSENEDASVEFSEAVTPSDIRTGHYFLAGGGASGGVYRVALTRGPVPSVGGKKVAVRPSAVIDEGGPRLRLRQELDWHLATGAQTLTADVRCDVLSGELRRLRLAAPDGFELIGVEPSGSAFVDSEGSRVVLLSGSAVNAGGAAEWRLVFSGPAPGKSVPFPSLIGATPAESVTTLHVGLDAGLAASVEADGPHGRVSVVDYAGPMDLAAGGAWSAGGLKPACGPSRYRYDCRGLPPRGTVGLTRRPARVAARVVNEVSSWGRRWSARSTIDIEPVAGPADSIVLRVAAGLDVDRVTVMSGGVAVAGLEELPGPGVGPWLMARDVGVLAAAALTANRSRLWRVRLTGPARRPVRLRVSYTAARGPLIPLLHVVGATGVRETAKVRAAAVTPTSADVSRSRQDGWAVFRAARAISLRLGKPTPAGAAVRNCRAAVYVTEDSALLVHLSGRLHGWSHDRFTFKLPPGAEPLAAAVGGAWADLNGQPGTVVLPTPSGSVGWEAVYSVPAGSDWGYRQLAAPLPRLSARVAVDWALPAGVVPLGGQGLRPVRPAVSRGPVGGYLREALGRGYRFWRRGAGRGRTISVARPGRLRWVGVAWAAVALAATMALSRARARGRWLLLGAWLGGHGVAAVWVDPTVRPALAAPVGVGLLIALAAIFRGVPSWVTASARRTGLRPSVVTGLVIAACVLGAGPAGETPAVYVLPAGADGQRRVLVPLSLLQQWGRREAATLPDAVLLGAHYNGQPGGDGYVFEAKIPLRVRGQAGRVSVPLSGVDLIEARIDGEPAWPSRRAGSAAYHFAVVGKGRHELVVKFRVPVRSEGGTAGVRFAGPRLCRSAVSVTLPGGATRPEFPGALGRTWVKGTRARADLGRSGEVAVRWRAAVRKGRNAPTEVREASVWHVTPGQARLYCRFDYRLKRGRVGAVRLTTRPGLAVARLRVSPAADASANWVRSWSWSRNGRMLQVRLRAPLGGEFRMEAEFVAGEGLTDSPSLAFPTAAGRVKAERLLGVRLEGFAAQNPEPPRGAVPYPVETFGEVAWRDAPFDAPPPTAVFRTESAGPAALNPTLREPAARLASRLTLDWQLAGGAGRVDAVGEWFGSAPVLRVEWAVPRGLAVTEVRGPGLRHWSRVGERVTAWLAEPARRVRLEWVGFVGGRPPFRLPGVRQVPPGPVAVTAFAGPGRIPTASQIRRLKPVPATRSDVLAFTTAGGGYSALIKAGGPPRLARSVSRETVRRRAGRWEFRADVVVGVAGPGPHTFPITVAAGRFAGWTIAGPRGVRVRREAGYGLGPRWRVETPGGGPLRFTIRAGLAGPPSVPFRMPRVSLESVRGRLRRERQLPDGAEVRWRLGNEVSLVVPEGRATSPKATPAASGGGADTDVPASLKLDPWLRASLSVLIVATALMLWAVWRSGQGGSRAVQLFHLGFLSFLVWGVSAAPAGGVAAAGIPGLVLAVAAAVFKSASLAWRAGVYLAERLSTGRPGPPSAR